MDETGELALPGTGIALREDQYLDEFEMLAALRLTPEPPLDNALLAPATLTIPLEGVSASTALFAYTFDGGQGYWKRAQSVSLVDGQVEVVAGQLGWWAIGSAPRTDRTCVVGSVRDAQGQPLPFADVVVRESAAFGRRNMSTDDLGRFCIDVVPDSEIQLDVYGLRADEPQFQYWSQTTWSPDLPETSTCADPVACADLGGIATELLVVR